MGKRLIIFLIFIVLVGGFVYWQYTVSKSLGNKTVSCGGDFSYMMKCPVGTYCKSLGQGPGAGGICSPYVPFK